jgi:UDP-N-acetylmuramate dehydrogenase
MNVSKDISIKPHNSFGIDVNAAYFSESYHLEDLKNLLTNRSHPNVFIISGGSNLLLTKDIDAHVIKICHKGIKLVSEKEKEVIIDVAAGENWHDLVLWSLEHNYGGIENLSLIPGCVGSAPIQNIGAYGVELKDVFVSCEVLEIETLKTFTLSAQACEFGYRTSVFKTAAKGKYVIYAIRIRLSKQSHRLQTKYGDIERILKENNTDENPSIKDISEAVISIRKSKLPDPKILGNSGSFFKNPTVDTDFFNAFHAKWPKAPFYKITEDQYKIPAGWLIEQSGLKGYRENDAGIHEKQALVIVNYGNASGKQLLAMAKKVIQTVKEKFAIQLEPEVNII